MRIDALHVTLTLLLGGAFVVNPASPPTQQDPPAPAAAAAPQASADDAAAKAQSAAGMTPDQTAALEKLAAVGPNHQFLAQMEGDWVGKFKMQMTADAPVQEFTAKAENDMMLGGRFLRTKLKAKIGQDKFEGFGMFGFDNAEQKFSAIWCDTWSTQINPISWGTLDSATRTITLVRECKDPLSGQMVKQRDVYIVPSANEYRFESYLTGADGKEFKMLESSYTKAPAKPEKDKSKEKK